MTTNNAQELNPPEFLNRYPKLAKALAVYGIEVPAIAASFPRLLTAIENGWGTRDDYDYIDGLLLTDRPDRHGFSSEVIDELLLIKNVYEVTFPKLTINRDDPFSGVRAVDIEERIKALAAAAQKAREEAAEGGKRHRVESAPPQGKVDEVSTEADLLAAVARLERGEVPSAGSRRRLGEYLVEAGVLEEARLQGALDNQRRAPVRRLLGEFLLADREIEPHQLYRALCRQRGIPIVDAAAVEVSAEAVRLVPIRIARLKAAVPVAFYERRLVVAVSNPFDVELQEYFSFLSGTRAVLVYSDPDHIAAALASYGQERIGDGHRWRNGLLVETGNGSAAVPYGRMQAVESFPAEFEEADGVEELVSGDAALADIDENDETVIGLVNKVINDAVRVGASDIHFEAFPRSRSAQIRFRKDGVMERHSQYPISYHQAVISRIKIIAEIDIAEKRKAQDGKIGFGLGGRQLDLRVSTIPTTHGIEAATVRILNTGRPLPLSRLGMRPTVLEAFRKEIAKPYGLILVCGPTGSGKTTTLHSVLRELNTPERKIWTAEDPVEVVQKNINQVQVLPKIGWTFANALRAFLRADPDVIMIGEIRDEETAKVAVEASMTGHLVMSTVHTNSAAETLARMIDLDVAAFNLADATLAILAQRLARRVCASCGERVEFSADELETLVNEYQLAGSGKVMSKAEREHLLARWRSEFSDGGPLVGVRGVGCSACNGSGYSGRLGLYELLVVSPEIRRLIRADASAGDIFRQAVAEGMKTLRQDGIEKVAQGLIDFREVRTVCL